MRRNDLFYNLRASLYALHGINGRFLGTLIQPIRLKTHGLTGVLVEFPAVKAARMARRIRYSELPAYQK